MNDDRFAGAPEPPYYAVIFASQRPAEPPRADDGYGATSDRMVELARERDGFLGVESARDAAGFGITVSYWRDEAAIAGWKADLEHREAQRRGRHDFYERFELRVARVERQKSFRRQGG
jgi:heme-degrading monooxygenase HmoA